FVHELTMVIQRWIFRSVRNQCMKVPLLGNMCGYDLSSCLCFSSRDVPWLYAAGGLRGRFSRAGCDGGRNLSGCSSTMGFPSLVEVEAARRRGGEVRLGRMGCLVRSAARKHWRHIEKGR